MDTCAVACLRAKQVRRVGPDSTTSRDREFDSVHVPVNVTRGYLRRRLSYSRCYTDPAAIFRPVVSNLAMKQHYSLSLTLRGLRGR